MSSDEDYPEWKRRRRFPLGKDPFFGSIDRIFSEMEKRMEEEFREFTDKVPKDYVKERKLPDGSTVKEFGPFVYGYSMKIGPDGKPLIREFGNIKKSFKGSAGIFYNRINNYISKIPIPEQTLTDTWQNISDAVIYGGEISGNYKIWRLTFRANISYLIGKDVNSDEYLSYMPPSKFKFMFRGVSFLLK